MKLDDEIANLSDILREIPTRGQSALGSVGEPIFIRDFVIAGAVKRTLSLGHGLLAMVNSKNMTCGRALVRMQIDTVSRLWAYTYVADPEEMARGVISGIPLNKFKSREGHKLTDGYLIDRMSVKHEWIRRVYNSTSGDVHFSEKQFFASVVDTKDAEDARIFHLLISHIDSYPEFSWSEIVACFTALCEILMAILSEYADQKVRGIPGRDE